MAALVNDAASMSRVSRDAIVSALRSEGLPAHAAAVQHIAKRVLVAQAVNQFNALYRSCINGTVTAHLDVEVEATQVTSTNWNLYCGAYKGWAANIVDTELRIRADYYDRVTDAGISNVSGLFVLDAVPVRRKAAGDVRLYAVKLIRQGRGNAISLSSEYVAATGGMVILAETPEEALKHVQWKLRAA